MSVGAKPMSRVWATTRHGLWRRSALVASLLLALLLSLAGPLVGAAQAGTIRVPAAGIKATVIKVGTSRTGIVIPENPQRVGWWDRSAHNRARHGASIIVGHVSDAHLTRGVFARLTRTERGDVVIWQTGSVTTRYRIIGKRTYSRSRPLPARLFRMHGPHVVRMITCTHLVRLSDGYFHYTRNLVVTAEEIRR